MDFCACRIAAAEAASCRTYDTHQGKAVSMGTGLIETSSYWDNLLGGSADEDCPEEVMQEGTG